MSKVQIPMTNEIRRSQFQTVPCAGLEIGTWVLDIHWTLGFGNWSFHS